MTSKSRHDSHDMGKAARIQVYEEFKGSGMAAPLPRLPGKFADIPGQLTLEDMGVIELPGAEEGEQCET